MLPRARFGIDKILARRNDIAQMILITIQPAQVRHGTRRWVSTIDTTSSQRHRISINRYNIFAPDDNEELFAKARKLEDDRAIGARPPFFSTAFLYGKLAA